MYSVCKINKYRENLDNRMKEVFWNGFAGTVQST
jgi:hypothetical protein